MDKCNATEACIPEKDRDTTSRVVVDGSVVYVCRVCHAPHPAHLFQPNGECRLALWAKTESVRRTLSPNPANAPRGRGQRLRRKRVPLKEKKPPEWKPITPRS